MLLGSWRTEEQCIVCGSAQCAWFLASTSVSKHHAACQYRIPAVRLQTCPTSVIQQCLTLLSYVPPQDNVSELLKEASLLGSVRHPNIVWVYGLVLPPLDAAVEAVRQGLMPGQGIDAVKVTLQMANK